MLDTDFTRSYNLRVNLQTFFQIPLVKFCVHLLLLVGFFLNIWHFYRIWDMNKRIEQEEDLLEILQQANSDARNQRDYFTSDLYKEKFAKQENYKLRGEEVVDTSVIEPGSDSEVGLYIKTIEDDDRSNPEKWYAYMFGEGR